MATSDLIEQAWNSLLPELEAEANMLYSNNSGLALELAKKRHHASQQIFTDDQLMRHLELATRDAKARKDAAAEIINQVKHEVLAEISRQ